MTYPIVPGYKVPGPSKDAAHVMQERAPALRARVLAELTRAYPDGLSAEEIAERLNTNKWRISPRISELHVSGEVQQTGERRKNHSGSSANCWRAVFGASATSDCNG